MSAPLSRNIAVEQTIILLEHSADVPSRSKPEQMSLEQAIRENIDVLGHSGSHTLEIFVQLLTTGKVRFSFRSHTKRLEVKDKKDVMTRSQALVAVEAVLSELRGEDPAAQLPEFTQNIVVQARKPGSSHL